MIELLDGYSVFGIRTLCEDEIAIVGTTCRESYDWDYEDDHSTYGYSNKTVGGTCSTYVDYSIWEEDEESLNKAVKNAVKSHGNYGYGTKVLIGGRRGFSGSDAGEMIIEDAIILAILN